MTVGAIIPPADRLLVAHQYGWDEALWFLIPVVLAVGAVRWAEKRAKQNREHRDGAEDGS